MHPITSSGPATVTVKVEYDDKVLDAVGFGDVVVETEYEEELIDLGWGIMYGPPKTRYFLSTRIELIANERGNFGTVREKAVEE